MPRTARAIQAGLIYHVLNRGNVRMRIFEDPADYQTFEQVLADPVEDGYSFLRVCRYVEASAVRADLAQRAELWPW